MQVRPPDAVPIPLIESAAFVMPRALLSVSDKTGLASFAEGLHRAGFELISTGGTARAIAAAGLPVVNVADVTGFPEMMDGRVKTLHPAVHGGILARRHLPEDLAALARHGIGLIDIIVVNLYPFARAAADPATPFDHLVEEIDIGGPSLVRAAAKNFRDVLVLVDPEDYARALDAVRATEGPSPAFRFELARKAFAHTAAYDTTIAATLGTIGVEGETFVRAGVPDAAPLVIAPALERVRVLRYGENPHQRAGWYATSPRRGFGDVQVLQGKELSYTNLLDLDAAARIVLEFDEPAAAVIKHTNPCGVATGASAAAAYVTARDADPLSAFGGIVGFNRPVDADAARAITQTFIEAIVAPGVDAEARAVLAKKTNLRVLVADFSGFGHATAPELELRSILGGVLAHRRDGNCAENVHRDPPDTHRGVCRVLAELLDEFRHQRQRRRTVLDLRIPVTSGVVRRLETLKLAVAACATIMRSAHAAGSEYSTASSPPSAGRSGQPG